VGPFGGLSHRIRRAERAFLPHLSASSFPPDSSAATFDYPAGSGNAAILPQLLRRLALCYAADRPPQALARAFQNSTVKKTATTAPTTAGTM